MASKEQKIRRNVRRSYIISTMSITLVLFMLGVVSYVTMSMLSVASRLRDSVVVSVELNSDMEDVEREELLQTIETDRYPSAGISVSESIMWWYRLSPTMSYL